MKTRRIRNRWLVLQYDDRPIDENYKKLMSINKEYCKKHDYEYKFVTKGYEDLPPYWRKVALVKNLLKKYKGILWLDTDAVVFNKAITITSIARSSKMFFKSGEILNYPKYHFNAGVWIIKNTPQMNDLMEEWLNNYKTKEWSRNSNGKWITSGKFAGPTYEQGVFQNVIYTSYEKYIQNLQVHILQGALEHIHTKNHPFIIHFMDRLKQYIPCFLKIFYK